MSEQHLDDIVQSLTKKVAELEAGCMALQELVRQNTQGLRQLRQYVETIPSGQEEW